MMKQMCSYPLFRSQPFGLLVTMLILDGLYVNSELIGFFKPIRYGLLFLFGGYLFYNLAILMKSNRIKKGVFLALTFHIFLLVYALLLSTINGGVFLVEGRQFLFLLLGVFLTAYLFDEIHQPTSSCVSTAAYSSHKYFRLSSILLPNFNIVLPFLLLLSPVLLFLTDSLIFLPSPHIAFEFDGASDYSQGTTGYFALGSIVFTFLAVSSSSFVNRLALLVLALGMLGLSALGGARGDFLVGVIVVLVMLIRTFSFKDWLFYMMIFLGPIIFFQPYINDILNELVIFQRLSVILEGNLGLRDILFVQSIELLYFENKCIVVGCGFNYFQVFYDYDYAMYPHNILLETIITYGIFIGGASILLVIMGAVYGYFGHMHQFFIYWVFLYFVGVGLKSGSLLSYTSIPALIFFMYVGLRAIKELR